MNVTEEMNVKDTEIVKSRTVMHRRWVNLGRREPVYDIRGKETWGVMYSCPKCGFTTTAVEDHIWQYNYCPNCGVQMFIREVTE